MTDKLEFASAEWLGVAEEILQKAVVGLDLGGKSFIISEEFTDPPPHLLREGNTTIAWHFTVSDDGVVVGEGAVEEADMRTRVDYQAVLPVARLVYGTGEEAMAEAIRLREAAQSTGERVGDEGALPPELLQRLFGVHNELAVRTL
jgi:hypothetical protein